jgi:hypothetical protein
MNLRSRVLLSILIGLLSGMGTYYRLSSWEKQAADFTFTWRAAYYLFNGQNPYTEIRPEEDYPFQTYFYYPLTAAIASAPFAWLPPYLAGAAFFGLSSALLAFALSAYGWRYFPVFISAPYIVALATVQWSPIILAAAILPPLGWLLTCKPNLGAAAFLYKPNWLGFTGSILFTGLSLLLLPSWPLDWWRIARSLVGHPPPMLVLPLGPLLLLGIICWRKAEGRLFLGLSLFPQLLFFYDQLPLWLIPPTLSTGLVYSALSWVAYFSWRFVGQDPRTGAVVKQPTHYILALIYLPALAMLLWEERSTLKKWLRIKPQLEE